MKTIKKLLKKWDSFKRIEQWKIWDALGECGRSASWAIHR